MINSFLSIWEISHRWHEANPDNSSPSDLPLEIQDTIRYICRGVLDRDLTLLDLVVLTSESTSTAPRSKSEIRYFRVDEIPPQLEKALYREYDKEVLNSYFVEADDLFHYCLHEQAKRSDGVVDLNFPSCWIHFLDAYRSETAVSDNSACPRIEIPPRPSQVDKQLCQAIAKTLWEIDPSMTIRAMTEHRAILIHGNGKLYQGKNTLRDWLSEVAPESVKKPGRPKKPQNQ